MAAGRVITMSHKASVSPLPIAKAVSPFAQNDAPYRSDGIRLTVVQLICTIVK